MTPPVLMIFPERYYQIKRYKRLITVKLDEILPDDVLQLSGIDTATRFTMPLKQFINEVLEDVTDKYL